GPRRASRRSSTRGPRALAGRSEEHRSRHHLGLIVAPDARRAGRSSTYFGFTTLRSTFWWRRAPRVAAPPSGASLLVRKALEPAPPRSHRLARAREAEWTPRAPTLILGRSM